MYAAIGYNGLSAIQVANRLTEKERKEREKEEALKEIITEQPAEKPKIRQTATGVSVAGADNLLIRLSRCCTPVPGDEIIGFITRGRGVSIHRKDCPNILAEETDDRLIEVEWEKELQNQKEYIVDIEINGFDRRGLLNEVIEVVSGTKTNISAVSGRNDRNKVATIMMSIEITNISHLRSVVDKIKQIPDIYAVRRIMN